MASFNRVILMGNLTRDVQLRNLSSGSAVAELGLAVNRKWFDKKANQQKEEVTFVDVTLWGRQAEIASEYLAKGRSVMIEGRLQMDEWEDRESGQKRSKLKVVCENMTMIGGKSEGGGGGGSSRGSGGSSRGSRGGSSRGNRGNTESFYDDAPDGDDVPF